jgi:hypothetical protein
MSARSKQDAACRLEPVKSRLTNVIAEREFRLVTKARKRKKVLVRLGKPRLFPEGGNYYCVYHILGLEEGDRRSWGGGADSMQALYLTLQKIMIDLVHTRAYREGRLTWEGLFDLGLPVIEPLQEHVRKDPQPKAAALRSRAPGGKVHRSRRS